eukprot:m.109397 g.109397  ORF g.109397 m.109397 type:complete len:706 (+) comp9039_c1_seq1:13-2130(+)
MAAAAGGSRAMFWKPGESAPRIQAERSSETELDMVPHNTNAAYSLSQQRARLPIFKYRENILHLLEQHTTLVLVGETGCGKSTQIPQYLYEAGWAAEGRIVACLQPRRVAAISVATRVAEEMHARLGDVVGYSIRFDDCYSAERTRIKYMTEGMLVREMMRDPLLSRYSAIMLDEAHERTLYMDIVLGLLHKIQRRRPDLRIIVSSATLDAQAFHSFFNANTTGDRTKDTSAILSVEGRTYPVDIFYAEAPVPDYVAATVEAVLAIHRDGGPGDILAFLTGQDEVDDAVKKIKDRLEDMTVPDMVVLPLYGGLSGTEQMKIFDSGEGRRKAVIATNIAEASVTIPGIVYVIDCGFVKMKGYNATSGIESLVVTPVSKASADQRAGRAGRMRAGKVYRLYTEDAYKGLPDATIPEMQRSNLAGVLLQLKALGIDNVLRFAFVSPPPAIAMQRGLELLFALYAIDDAGKLTAPLGVQLAEFPLEPMHAKMLLASAEMGCSAEILSITAMLQVQNVFLTPPNRQRLAQRARLKFSVHEGDHITLLNVYNCFIKNGRKPQWCGSNYLNFKSLSRAFEIRGQLVKYLQRFGAQISSCKKDVDMIRRCIVRGFFANAARLHMDGTYRTIRGSHALAVHPSSVLFTERYPPYVVFNEVVLTSECFMRDITAVEPEWLSELAPHYYRYRPEFDGKPDPEEAAAKRPRQDLALE